MEEYYIKKYNLKTDRELQKIIENKHIYRIDAVNAAIKILNERNIPTIPLIERYVKTAQPYYPIKDVQTKSSLFYPFFRSLSYREFLTAIGLVLFYLAYLEILDFYSSERILKNSIGALKKTGFIVMLFANHIIYKYEHSRPDNFMGRSVNSIFLIIIFMLIKYIHSLLSIGETQYSFNSNELGGIFILILLVIAVFLFESMVSILRFLLKYVKCQIF